VWKGEREGGEGGRRGREEREGKGGEGRGGEGHRGREHHTSAILGLFATRLSLYLATMAVRSLVLMNGK
jgi:hypothetical protein